MKTTTYALPIETPNGLIHVTILHTVASEHDPRMGVSLSSAIQGKDVLFHAESTEEALIMLAENLPSEWKIKSCISCRHGHFCPVGDMDNELFCMTDFTPQTTRDLWHVTEDEQERTQRMRTLFDCCEDYEPQSKDYFTYSDYYFRISNQ